MRPEVGAFILALILIIYSGVGEYYLGDSNSLDDESSSDLIGDSYLSDSDSSCDNTFSLKAYALDKEADIVNGSDMETLCTITPYEDIVVFKYPDIDDQGESWYMTEFCGLNEVGYIHNSMIDFYSSL